MYQYMYLNAKFLWVLIVLPFSSNCSFICMGQTSYRGF